MSLRSDDDDVRAVDVHERRGMYLAALEIPDFGVGDREVLLGFDHVVRNARAGNDVDVALDPVRPGEDHDARLVVSLSHSHTSRIAWLESGSFLVAGCSQERHRDEKRKTSNESLLALEGGSPDR